MSQLQIALAPEDSVERYREVQAAFRRVLGLSQERLTDDDLRLAADILGCEINAGMSEEAGAIAADTALYSRPGEIGARSGNRRAIDRIVPKLPVKRDPAMAALAARLPDAAYSVYEVERVDDGGAIAARDLLDGGRPLRIMDESLVAHARPGRIFAMRLIDAGPWHIAFGIVHALKKSEAVAIGLALSYPGVGRESRESLHELVYPCRLQGGDLVIAALEPVIHVLAVEIDESEGDAGSLLAAFTGAVAVRPRGARRRKAA
jgi:hypothetical protein